MHISLRHYHILHVHEYVGIAYNTEVINSRHKYSCISDLIHKTVNIYNYVWLISHLVVNAQRVSTQSSSTIILTQSVPDDFVETCFTLNTDSLISHEASFYPNI